MRLFTAVWPSAAAIEHLAEHVERIRSAPELAAVTRDARGFRFIPPRLWHLTLCFHGDADQQWLSDRLDRRTARLIRKDSDFAAPRMRIRGAGVFRGVLWVGVEPADEAADAVLRTLVRAAGANPNAYRGHVTVARWSAGRPQRAGLIGLFEDYTGPWWHADAVALVASELHEGQRVYRTVHSVAVPQGQGR